MRRVLQVLRTDVGWIIAIGLFLVLVQIGATLVTAASIDKASERIASDLASLHANLLTDEKTRQEVLDLRVQNELRGFLSNSLLVGIGPVVTAFVALVGALLGLRNFLAARDKDREARLDALDKERAERERARLDRASTELKETIDRLVKNEIWQRAAGVLGLQHFLSQDLREYHLRAVSALAMASRLEDNKEVVDAIRIAVEQAVKNVSVEVRRQVDWQWTKLDRARLSPESLRGLDFRNACLNDADLARCDLSGSLLTNAKLRGARLDRCKLAGADLAYADLAGASLVDADLTNAALFHAKVMRMDVAGADLRGAKLDAEAMPWELIANWRRARLDEDLYARLLERFGPEPSGPKVLMLMWELPPFVAGGTWTACYHLVRNLRRRGADVTVVVPWDERLVASQPFGAEVRVVALGITPPELEPPNGPEDPWNPGRPARPEPSWSGYGSPYGAPYGSPLPWSAYSSAPSWSPYGWLATQPGQGPYGATSPWRAYGPYGAALSAYGGLRGPSSLLRLIDECRRRAIRFARTEPFDVIHAHDWVTFGAAAAVAEAAGKPWIAHFHSIERDRRPELPDQAIERIELRAVQGASAVVAPSKRTALAISSRYHLQEDAVTVAPNTLSRESIPPSELGLHDTRRTLFLGRLTAQKGPDLFARIADQVRRRIADASFDVRGAGEQVSELWQAGIRPRGAVEWVDRGRAFGDASAVLVPSRSEPFGMVILEGMQHHVPVLYPRAAGAAEVLEAGIRIDPLDIQGAAAELERLLVDRSHWEETVRRQTEEIKEYPERGYEEIIRGLYGRLAGVPGVPGA